MAGFLRWLGVLAPSDDDAALAAQKRELDQSYKIEAITVDEMKMPLRLWLDEPPEDGVTVFIHLAQKNRWDVCPGKYPDEHARDLLLVSRVAAQSYIKATCFPRLVIADIQRRCPQATIYESPDYVLVYFYAHEQRRRPDEPAIELARITTWGDGRGLTLNRPIDKQRDLCPTFPVRMRAGTGAILFPSRDEVHAALEKYAQQYEIKHSETDWVIL